MKKEYMEMAKELYEYMEMHISSIEDDWKNCYLTDNSTETGDYLCYTDENREGCINLRTGEITTDSEKIATFGIY